MAGSSSASITGLCRKCNKNAVKNTIKCSKCANIFHHSCAKSVKNVSFVSESEIICCGVNDSSARNDYCFSALEAMTVNNKVDINIVNYMLSQKDIIINEMQDKIDILNNQIKLLYEHIVILKDKSCIDNKDANNSDTPNKKQTLRQVNKTSNSRQNKSEDQLLKQNNKYIRQNNDSLVLLEDECKQQMNEIINLDNNNITEPSNQRDCKKISRTSKHNFFKNKLNAQDISDGDQKDEILNRNTKNKRKIVGKNTELNIKGVPKFVKLHVYRVDVNTSADDLKAILKNSFPEVKCDTLASKHPQVYSSFVIEIFEKHFNEAMNPDVWPSGACVRRFFQINKKVMTTE